ncbi:twin-arginine translocase subunit TatC [Asticcacaulis sp. BYS171W]|uniref:Sec-independent protein translocase protein TatC n=1 Tax=Asticcacaulis aquaticus TaxID=2984212 RepID=A0ABT5HW34_9CAUL|nr:twin-arginine translocase subunit TatC [Asticcacaulis aquaticus]MDC7684280.1 twin-arginine translocase subunit TatC [Asticcacaulis aquaticus]
MNDIVTRDDADEHDIESSRAPLMDHLIELRSRLIWMVAAFAVAFIACFTQAERITIFLLHPFVVANEMFAVTGANNGHAHGPFDMILVLLGFKEVVATTPAQVISTGALEVLFTKMKIAGFGAIIVSFPIIAWHIYRFVAPGLYKRERMAFLPFLIAAPILFVLGALLVYYIMLPMVLWFSLDQQIFGAGQVSVQLLPKISEYLSLVTTLMLAFGLCFQLPIVLTLLGLTGMVSAKMLSQGRRYAILGIVVVAAVVTPPDPISQLMLAIPIAILYEISIVCVRVIEWRRKEPAA